jgi:hypothetical protein
MIGNRTKAWPLSWLEQCLMRRAPQDDPLSYSALLGSLAAYVILDLSQAGASSGWVVSVGMTVMDTLVMIVFTWTVLMVVKKSPRFIQTLTALAGTGAVLGVLGLPLVYQAAKAHQADGPSGALVLGWLVLLAWSIAVQAHIFRHALSTRYGIGLMVAALHTVLAISLLETLFPRAAG